MPTIRYLTVTNIIVVLCVLAFVIKQALVGGRHSGFELFFFLSNSFNPVQLLSHMFLHGSLSHLLFNMLGLWMFGSVIEQVWGAKRFVIFYFVCGLGAALIYQSINYIQFQLAIAPLLDVNIPYADIISTFSDNQFYRQFPSSEKAAAIFLIPMVGASAAIYAVLVAFACLFPNYKIMLIFLPVPIAAKFFVPILLGFDLLSGITGFSIFGANIAHGAHIGGAIMGFIFVLLFRKRSG